MTAWSGTIAVEDWPSTDGRFLLPGSVKLPRGPVALITTGPHRLVGTVDVVERDGDLIRASGELREDIEIPGLAMTAKNMSATNDKQRQLLVASSLEIAAVFVSDHPAWPECRLD